MEPLKRRSAPSNLDAATLLDKHQVAARLGIGLWTLGAWMRSGRFPRPIRITDSCHRWRLSDLLAWIDAKAREPHRAPRLRGKAARWHPKPKIVRVRASDPDGARTQ
jgi:predicted DNA-binding transcriptional regulator AlpA